MNPRGIVRGLVATTMLATAGGVFVVAVAYAVFAAAQEFLFLTPAGASAVVAGLAALGILIGALVIGRKPKKPKVAAPPPPETFLEKAVDFLKDKPIVAVAAAIGVGILAVRNPAYIGAAVRSFMEPRNPPRP